MSEMTPQQTVWLTVYSSTLAACITSGHHWNDCRVRAEEEANHACASFTGVNP